MMARMSTCYPVESNVPPPDRSVNQGGGGKEAKYPWAEMSAGDSFVLVASTSAQRRKLQNRVGCAGRQWCQRNAPHLTPVTESGELPPGRSGYWVRVWLVRDGPDLSKYEPPDVSACGKGPYGITESGDIYNADNDLVAAAYGDMEERGDAIAAALNFCWELGGDHGD